MVGISTGFGCHSPGFIPGEIIIIHKDTHEFRNSYRRMGIIELERHLLVEFADIVMLSHIFFHRFLYGGRNEEILLLQTKLLACIMVIVGIKHLNDIPCQVFLLYGLLVIPFIKGFQLEAFHRLRIPDAQSIHNTVSIAYDRHIIGNSLYGLIALLLKAVASVFIHKNINISAELDLLGIFRTAEFKRIAVGQPVVRHLNLIAVPDFLFEHSVAVSDPASISRIAQGCQGIQETSRQTSQSAVAQRRIRFLIFHCIDIDSQLFKSFLHILISLQINQVISQCTAHQKFHGKIIYSFRILLLILLLGIHPIIYDDILDGIGNRLENLLLRSLLQGFPVKGLYIIHHTVLE